MIYFRSREFEDVLNRAKCFAMTDWPVLIVGDTGVGKEVVAREIHQSSFKGEGPFVPVNCTAIPAGLFESELFGHEKGAFSGAVSGFRGLARTAEGGTLFLDEVGDLELSLQSKLLRLVELGEVRAVGSRSVSQENIRIIAATNVDLWAAATQGKFRLDLLERLSVLVLRIPALKERPRDIQALVLGFSSQHGVSLPKSVLPDLMAFPWPGNARQLKNVIIRCGVLGNGTPSESLVRDILAEERSRSVDMVSLQSAPLADIEKQVIVDRLRRNGGNRKKTADDLGIAKSTLHEKLRRWRMPGIGPCVGTA